MRAGELRHRVTVEQYTETQNAVGEPVKTWSTYAVLDAAINPLVGTERIQSAQVNANAFVQMTLRYYPGITPKMRVVAGGRTYQIASVVNVDERNRELDLLTVETL